jgi:magnesium transporter
MELSIIGYDPVGAWTKYAENVGELLSYRNPAGVNWINIIGLEDAAAINELAESYHIHPLTVEDILNTEQRPKVEEFNDYILIIVKSIREAPPSLIFEQMSIIISGNTVLSFQQFAGDSFDGIRRRISDNSGRVRRMGADYLAYLLWDAVVDEYFTVLDFEGGIIEDLEDRATNENDPDIIPDIQENRRRLIRLRRAIAPLRESILTILKIDESHVSAELSPFFKDLQENVMQAMETVETYREIINGIVEVNYSVQSNRTNKVMKVLTIISSLFIPLTFIVGVYGMNFQYMPELHMRYAYPLCWAAMLLIAGAMLLYFKKRKWF